MGFELEVDCYRESNDVKSLYAYNIAKKTDRLMFIERDGSIDNGFEIISEPMDMQWLREGGKDKIEAMFDYINQDDVNIREHDSCGLHVHVDRDCLVTTSRTHEEVVDNIYLIVETFKNELIKFSRRSPNSVLKIGVEAIDILQLTILTLIQLSLECLVAQKVTKLLWLHLKWLIILLILQNTRILMV